MSVRSLRSEAVDVDLDLSSQLGHQMLDVNTCPAVDVGRPLTSQHSDAHATSLDGLTPRRRTVVPIRLG